MKASKRATQAGMGLLVLLALGITTLGRHQVTESSRSTEALAAYRVYDTAGFGPPPDITNPPPDPPAPTPTPTPVP